MKELIIEGRNSQSRILVGEKVANLGNYLPAGKVVAITDENVIALYPSLFNGFETIIIQPGEDHKNGLTVESIYNDLLILEADRSTFVVGFGGGLVCDIAGYVASTYMRGLRFGFVSSTLLSQVDASVGGKNGVNFQGFKNMIGTFNQPEFVLCDPALLNTLPEKEVRSGFGEIIKHSLIADSGMLSFLEKNREKALSLHPEVIEYLVFKSVEIKSAIVNLDETEKGERRKLNFGHTLGHAIESLTGQTHGESVAIGMVLAARISNLYGLISSEEVRRAESLIESFDLPTTTKLGFDAVFNQLTKDKKRDNNNIHFVMLENLGNASVRSINLKELRTVLEKIWK
ncbi:MAG: 3-dehydroquinate synthase [Bacteroidales bacterium]|nr:3-dehydroquinate synthase [Bacteroidales bacterium]MCF8455317.1 3-dehydroquinate synthase [Bacteroidales bacterium]